MGKRRPARESLAFLHPLAMIKEKQFSRNDIRQVKANISLSFSMIRIIVASVLAAASIYFMIFMNTKTGGGQIQTYGLFSLVAQIISLVGNGLTILVIVPSFFVKNERAKVTLNRIGSDILFLTTALQMLFGIYADAEAGFSTKTETMSASIVLVSVLILIQPAYWFDALLVDVGTTLSLIAISIYCTNAFGMESLHYYLVVSVIYPVACYFVVSLLFYASAQRYKEAMENERLTDKAYYDALTLCKNRHALANFLKDGIKNWEDNNSSLLLVLFDIDNFKLYNDQFSHLGGDYCLKSIAEAIRRAFPSPSLDFFRYGGEEFLLFFELDNPSEASTVVEKVRNAIKDLKLEAPKGAPKSVVTISVGGLLIEDVTSFSFEDEMKIVDSYLYIAKAAGKDVSCLNGDLIDN